MKPSPKLTLLFAALGAATLACSPTTKPPRIEDEARQMAPPPACIMRLEPRQPNAVGRNLREKQYWSLVFPTFEQDKRSLPANAVACTGRPVFDSPVFKDAERSNVYPAPVAEGDILLGSGGDRLRVLWFRTHHTKDGHEAGPLALVRTREDFADVYAVGAYRGRSKRPLFGLERIGVNIVVTVLDENCTGPDYAPGTACESTLAAYLPYKGVLEHLTTMTVDRRAFAKAGEPGAPGTIQYHLTGAPRWTETGIVLSEQLVATDEAERELRHAELDRVFTLVENHLTTTEEPLWPRVYPADRAVDSGPAAERPSDEAAKTAPEGEGAPPSEPKPKLPTAKPAKPGKKKR